MSFGSHIRQCSSRILVEILAPLILILITLLNYFIGILDFELATGASDGIVGVGIHQGNGR